MAEKALNWFVDIMASTDIIDAFFIVSELIDIPISEADLCESAYYDSLATYSLESEETLQNSRIPLGKLVI